MSSVLPSTLFSSKESFAQMLPRLLHQQAILAQIAQHLTTDLEIFEKFGLIFIEQLTDQTSNNLPPIIALTCFNTYLAEYLADAEKVSKDAVDKAHSMMFSYCLKIRNNRQDLDDIEIYHVLYPVLEQCAPLSSVSWQKELDLLSLEREKKLLQHYDDLIENYIQNPNEYPVYSKEQESDVVIRFSLFNILFESKLEPFYFKNDKHFTFSGPWINVLKHALHSSMNTRFGICVQITEKKLWDLQAEHLDLELPQNTAFDTHFCEFSNRREFETTFRECLQALKVAHPTYISTIAYSLTQLIQYARISYNDDKQFQGHIDQMSQAIWFEMYQSLLNDAVFETIPCRESPTIAKLFKIASCYIQFRLAVEIPFTDFPMSVWDNYHLQRSIFLKSTGTRDDMLLIEKVVFASTCAL